MARPCLDQRAVDAEVFRREMAAHLRRLHRLIEQTHDDVVREQSLAIPAERRVVPDRIVHRRADKRNSMLQELCSISMRLLRIEYSTCRNNARISFSGAMLGLPPFASLSYVRANTPSMRFRASFSQR